jgi:hypothetical protein
MLKLNGNNLTINYGTGNVFPTISANKFTLYPNGDSVAASRKAIDLVGNITFAYTGNNSNSIGLNFTSHNTSIRAYGFTFYGGGGFSTNSGYSVIGPNFTYNSGADLTARLGVVGKHNDNTSYAFRVQNSDSDELMQVRNDGAIAIGKGTAAGDVGAVIIGQDSVANQRGVSIGRSVTSGQEGICIGYEAGLNAATGRNINIGTYAQGSGTASIMLNSSAGFQATNTTPYNFGVYMSSNTTPDFRVIGNEGMIPPSITTTVRNAISSPVTGSTIYNTTDNKLQFYNGSAWADAAGGDSIYTADGTISENRIVTIANNGNVPYSVNFKGNSGAAGAGPVFLQIENERVDAAYSTNSGAQLRLKGGSSSGSLNTDLDIIAHGSNYGGSSAPQVHFNSNRGYTFTAGTGGSTTSYGVSQDLVLKSGDTGQIVVSTTTNFGNNTNTTIAMTGGGGGSSSMIQIGKSGDDIGKFFRGSANGVLQIGKHSGGAYGSAGTTTTEMYVDGSSNVGIGDNTTINARLHVKGAGATSATTSLLVENSNGDDLLSIKDDGTFTLGKGASSTDYRAVSIGAGATASNSFDICIGTGTASGGNSIAIGRSSSSGADAIAMGNGANSGANGVAMGQVSTATGTGVAIGLASKAPTSSIGLGAKAKGTGANSITLNANGSDVTPSTANEFGVYMTSNTTPDFRVIGAEGMVPPSITTTVRDAISSPASGSTIYNTTNNKLQFYNGSAWTDAGGGGDNIYTADGTIASTTRTITTTGTSNIIYSLSSNSRFYINSLYVLPTGGIVTPISGYFQINSYSTRLQANYLLLYSSTYITGTTAGFVTVSGTTGTSHSINARLGVIGKSATSTTDYAFRVQDSASADMLTVRDDGVFTLGKGATNNAGNNSVIIGKSATDTAATNTYNTIIGASASVTGANNAANVVVGDSSLSTASGGVAIGSEAQSNAVAAIAIGQRAKPTGANSVTLDATGTSVTAPNTANAFGVYMSNNTTPDFRVAHDGNSYITGSGNFGVGVTNPTHRIQTPTSIGITGDSTNNGKLFLYCSAGTAHYVSIEGPDHLGGSQASYNIKLPDAAPAANQVLQSDSSGNLSWVNPRDLNFSGLPTSDPGVSGRLWNNEGVINVSE